MKTGVPLQRRPTASLHAPTGTIPFYEHDRTGSHIVWLACAVVILFCWLACQNAGGQAPSAPGAANLPEAVVTINADDAEISGVLQAFSMQSGISIVIGPDVTGKVTMRLSEIPWQEALDIILKPYGYGYRMVGQTIVVNKLEAIAAAAAVEPTLSRVFTLKYLDAGDVTEIVTAQLSGRGALSVLSMRGQKGWEFESEADAGRYESGSAASVGKRKRVQGEDQVRSKVLIVTDVLEVLDRVERVLTQIDVQPQQVLIQAKFLEVASDKLKDLGVEFGVQGTVREGSDVYRYGLEQTGDGVQPSAFGPRSSALSAVDPFNAGWSLAFERLTDVQYNLMLHALQEDAGANVLSAPRILTLNNQEATIVVGTKFPIIRSEISGESASISTALEYYENIGIQLNVVPQICDGGFINMIVHPAVTDQIGTASAKTGAGSDIPLTEFPILSTREAETQILIRSGHTIVIGGLLEDHEKTTVLKVPLLGDIPLVGHLFRRETRDNDKTDLLIFLTATIQPAGAPEAIPLVDIEALYEMNEDLVNSFNRNLLKDTEVRP